MAKIIDSKKSYGVKKWFIILLVSSILFGVSLCFINYADFFADNVKFLLDDPYIYWISGWILFVFGVFVFPFSVVKFILGCVQYFKSDEFKTTKNQGEAEE